jgi:glutaminyl-tRNA synthetase
VDASRTHEGPGNFLRDIIAEDLASGRHQRVVTRFPPEPNGFLHIGHAKSICLNFGVAAEFSGVCHLRMDDTNPVKEDPAYVENIRRDVAWLGFDWGDNFFAASDYFPQLYAWALELVDRGLAYVDDLSEEEIRAYRGTVTEAGRPSPWRDRTPAENRALLEQMRAGDFADGSRVLRAKGDLGSPNMKMRDPLMYRIRRVRHHAAGAWNVYPMYDYAHCLSDYIEGITHSFCTLEFEVNRELYDWFLEILALPLPRPRQYEFARLNLAGTMMSKRRLLAMVQQGLVSGWDDPRMPTLAGLRRRGVTPEAIRSFAERIGVARADNLVDPAVLDAAIRDDLDARAPRRMVVLQPLRVWLSGPMPAAVDARDWPEASGRPGGRTLAVGSEIWVDREDFAEDPPKGWHRLTLGGTVRLRWAGVIRCDEVVRGTDGEVVGLRCSAVPDGKAKGVIHWVPGDAPEATVRLYEPLFLVERPDAVDDWQSILNPRSCVVRTARVEPSLREVPPEERFQFERAGFFYVDPVDSRPGAPVFHRVLPLKDSYTQSPAPAARPVAAAAPAPAAVASPHPRTPASAAWVARGVVDELADVLGADVEAAAFAEAVIAAGTPPAAAAAWTAQELRKVKGGVAWSALRCGPTAVATLAARVASGAVTHATARQVLEAMVADGVDPDAYVAANDLGALHDDAALAPMVDAVLAALPDKVAQYRAGRTGLLGMFVGQVLQRTRGRADAQRVQSLLAARLG